MGVACDNSNISSNHSIYLLLLTVSPFFSSYTYIYIYIPSYHFFHVLMVSSAYSSMFRILLHEWYNISLHRQTEKQLPYPMKCLHISYSSISYFHNESWGYLELYLSSFLCIWLSGKSTCSKRQVTNQEGKSGAFSCFPNSEEWTALWMSV